MKTVIKLIGILTIIGATFGVANAKSSGSKPNIDPAHLNCTIVFPDGQIIKGNGKNDSCLFYEETEGVEIFYHNTSNLWPFNLNTNEFMCELENGEFMQIIKNVYRIDEYIVKVFGHIYTAYGVSSSQGIADHLIVKNTTVAQFEPTTIVFNSKLGEPTDIAVHLQGGRAPLYYNISCKQIH